MKPYGPVSVTINTPFQIGIDASATVVQVHNNTGMSLRLYFGAAAPASPTYPSQWHATIDPGAHPVLPVNGQQYFDGTLSFYPFNVQGAQSQQAGSISASSFVSVEAYFSGEAPPQSVYSPVFQQGAAQQRVVSVPMASTSPANDPYAFVLTQAGVFPWLWSYVIIPTGANIVTASAAQNSRVAIPVYLHYVHMTLQGNAAGTNAFSFRLDAVLLDNSLLSVKSGPITLFYSAMSAPGAQGMDHIAHNMSNPTPIPLFVVPPTQILAGDCIGVRIRQIGNLGTWNLFPNIGFGCDFTNQSPVGFYGGVNPQGSAGIAPTSPTNPQTF